MELKTTHLQEYIRPKLLVEALQYLKKNNIFYQDVNIDEDFSIEICRSDDKIEAIEEESNDTEQNQPTSSTSQENIVAESENQQFPEKTDKDAVKKDEKNG